MFEISEKEIKMLLVDDDPTFLKQFEVIFSKENELIDTVTATSPEEGLELVSSEDFDIIVADYKMPRMSGVAFLKKIRAEGLDIPFILLTGRGGEEVAMKAINEGADRYLRKDSDLDFLLSALEDYIYSEVSRWRSNKQVERISEIYSRLFENLGDGVVVFSLDDSSRGEILDFNKEFRRQTGYSEEELIEMNILEILLWENGEELDYYAETLLKGEDITFTEKKLRKNGTEFWVEVVATKIGYKGKDAALAVSRDISDRKSAQKRLEEAYKAMEASEDAFISLTESQEIFYCNEATSKIFGYSKDELVGESVEKLVPKEQWKDHKRGLSQFLKRGEGRRKFLEVEGVRKDGSKFPIEWNFSYVEREDGTRRIIGVGRDITERKKRKAKKIKEDLVLRTSEDINGNIIREYDEEFSASELGLSETLEHFAELSTNPPPENIFELLVVGIQKVLKKKNISVEREEIKRNILPTFLDFIKNVISISKNNYIDVPSEYFDFKESLSRQGITDNQE